MRIKRPLGLSGLEIGLVTVLGVLGGIYIWKPSLQQVKEEREANRKQDST